MKKNSWDLEESDDGCLTKIEMVHLVYLISQLKLIDEMKPRLN